VQRHRENIEKGRKRIEELRATLTKRDVPKDLSPFEQVDLAHRRDRAVRRFESLPPDARRAALRGALEARDVNFLEPLYSEPGLLSTQDAQRVEAVLMEGADPKLFAELTDLAGRIGPDGQHDPVTSGVMVPCIPRPQAPMRSEMRNQPVRPTARRRVSDLQSPN
jgi:hypothetical protein